jgi:hypothetical protein
MEFKTKLDFSNNRQVKQNVESLTVLSGATSFGVSFDKLPKGPNLSTSAETQSFNGVISTFSGNNTTTVYDWYDSKMEAGLVSLSAITPSNSGVTQDVDVSFSANNTTIIDGNVVALDYFGVEYDITPIAMVDLGGGNYSGSVISEEYIVYSAASIDFTGRTIWVDVSGITRTEDLIITKNAGIGKYWMCSDSEGKGEWSDLIMPPATNAFVTGGAYRTILETQTILAEDNNIDLNYNGTTESALGGGITVLHAKGDNLPSELLTDENGDWVTNNDFKPKSLTIPLFTPNSSEDINGVEGNVTRDDDYLYIKTINGWRRIDLESF